MRRRRADLAAVMVLAGLVWTPAAVAYQVREQVGIVTAVADGTTATDTLPIDSDGSVSVTLGTPEPGRDYAFASLQTEFLPNELHVVGSADVAAWGNEGGAKVILQLQFSVSQNTPYTLDIPRAEAYGLGWLGDRASIVLLNDDGVILRRNPGGGFDPCNFMHPDVQTLCKNRTFTPGVYTLEVRVSSYAPGDCGSCKGYATSGDVEISILF